MGGGRQIQQVHPIRLVGPAVLVARDVSAANLETGSIATAGETPVTIAHYLGLTPKWVDGTGVGGCSFMIHVRYAVAAIA